MMQFYSDTPATRFHQEFPGILLRLHSSRIPPDQARVSTRELRTPAEVSRLFSVFRATRWRMFVGSGVPWASPLRIGELVARLDEVTMPEHARFLPDRFLQDGLPPEVVVPAYSLGGEDLLLLDGNHRATALALTGGPFVLKVRVLEAPVDRRYLFDLRHWDGGSRRFLRRMRRAARHPEAPQGNLGQLET
jgi:hypothetical protein